MKLAEAVCQTYIDILKEELVPAMGCTEPIAIAYCAAKTREILGKIPEKVVIECSGNIIKNVKSVIVPNTGGLKGIQAAAAAGFVAGKEEKLLEVISEVTEKQKEEIRAYLSSTPIQVLPLDNESCDKLDIIITVAAGEERAKVRVSHRHSNISYIEKNGEVLYEEGVVGYEETVRADRSLLNIHDIIQFAEEADLTEVASLLQQQVDYNYAIAEEGLKNNWGANVGSVLLAENDSLRTRAKAMAAAGSDARMSGCELPVMINSGSGNQGITVSVPVAVYAKAENKSKEELYRALIISNLIAVHIKTGIGPLSAFCGAVSAGCAAGCAIAYLQGGREDVIAHTLVNSIAIVSGIVCDGAKPSCAAKIAAAIDAAYLGYDMYRHGQQFYGGDGIVSVGVENTIRNIGRLGADGMGDTDREIIRIMTD